MRDRGCDGVSLGNPGQRFGRPRIQESNSDLVGPRRNPAGSIGKVEAAQGVPRRMPADPFVPYAALHADIHEARGAQPSGRGAHGGIPAPTVAPTTTTA